MNISEKELFYFIFYPDKLSEEVTEFIKMNIDIYKDEIDLLKLTKATMNEKVPEDILKKIHQKIKDYEDTSFVVLKKVDNNTEIDNELLALAADSPKIENSNTVATYADKNSKYLVKIISNTTENRLHIFNKDNEEIKNFQITILPSGTTFDIESSNTHLVVKPMQEIASISFNL
jgi:hypothetical protein